MYYLQSRYYDPAVGRFVNGDEVTCLYAASKTNEFNYYSYCANNTIMCEDATGQWFILRRWMIAVPIDIVLSALGVGAVFAPVKALAKSAGKKFMATSFRKTMFKFLGYIQSEAVYLATNILYKLKTIKLLMNITFVRKKIMKFTAKSLASAIFGMLFSSAINKVLNILINNIDVCLSLGGVISGIWDCAYDGKMNNVLLKV